ncbi:MAG: hypothetical protein ACYSWP_12070 [Planctomycetota bacterium]|jgi:hypothetical protein
MNLNNKDLLLTLDATDAIRQEMFLYSGLKTLDMIGTNWMAKKIFLAHSNTGQMTSDHELKDSKINVNVIENDSQIIIRIKKV